MKNKYSYLDDFVGEVYVYIMRNALHNDAKEEAKQAIIERAVTLTDKERIYVRKRIFDLIWTPRIKYKNSQNKMKK